MRKIYAAVGITGIIAAIILAIVAFANKQILVGIVCLANIVSFAIYITISNLMDKVDKLEQKVTIMESYLLTTDNYIKFNKSIEAEAKEELNNN